MTGQWHSREREGDVIVKQAHCREGWPPLAASTQELATPVVQGGRRGYGLTQKIERVGDGSGGRPTSWRRWWHVTRRGLKLSCRAERAPIKLPNKEMLSHEYEGGKSKTLSGGGLLWWTLIDTAPTMRQPVVVHKNTFKVPTALQFFIDRVASEDAIDLWIDYRDKDVDLSRMQASSHQLRTSLIPRCHRLVIYTTASKFGATVGLLHGVVKPQLEQVAVLVWGEWGVAQLSLDLSKLLGVRPLSELCLVGIIPATWDIEAYAQLTSQGRIQAENLHRMLHHHRNWRI
ncbi:hypothetical protein C8J57DRAFT_1260652 [Mycena rebaudengoi]|nr:hypothetical protein C8J57DRAFT_1260652 [Mycena rebaudengoi]